MGIANRAFPFFSAIDAFFVKLLSPTISLVLWGILGGAISMLLYKFLSSQERIMQCKKDLAAVRRELSGFEGDFIQILPLLKNQISLSLKHVALTMWPACLASGPLFFLLAWLSVEQSHVPPQPDAWIVVEAQPASIEVTWSTEYKRFDPGKWRIAWPTFDRIAAHAAGAEERIIIPNKLSLPIIHKRQWWNTLIGNPAGYIPNSASIDRLHFQLAPAHYINFGLSWMRGWEFTFFTVLVLTSIVMKYVFRLH